MENCTQNKQLARRDRHNATATPNWSVLSLVSLSQWSTVLLENLTVTQLANKLPASYGTRRSITMFTTDHNWNLSWARWIQKRSTKGAIQIRGTVFHFV